MFSYHYGDLRGNENGESAQMSILKVKFPHLYIAIYTGVIMKCTKKHVKDDFVM